MHEFDTNATAVRINDSSVVDRLRSSGFILHGAPGIPLGGVTVRGVVSALPDGTYSMKCVYFESEGKTPSGVHMHAQRDLGYLTQIGVDALRKHQHADCDTALELNVTPTISSGAAVNRGLSLCRALTVS